MVPPPQSGMRPKESKQPHNIDFCGQIVGKLKSELHVLFNLSKLCPWLMDGGEGGGCCLVYSYMRISRDKCNEKTVLHF